MPYTHARRRGATMLFRRKIPADLRDRFGTHEIVRSIGHATPGEARRVLNRLWCQTEMVFMRVRSERGLTRDEIAKVVTAAVDAIYDARQSVLDRAFTKNPQRFVRATPKPPAKPIAAWINPPPKTEPGQA